MGRGVRLMRGDARLQAAGSRYGLKPTVPRQALAKHLEEIWRHEHRRLRQTNTPEAARPGLNASEDSDNSSDDGDDVDDGQDGDVGEAVSSSPDPSVLPPLASAVPPLAPAVPPLASAVPPAAPLRELAKVLRDPGLPPRSTASAAGRGRRPAAKKAPAAASKRRPSQQSSSDVESGDDSGAAAAQRDPAALQASVHAFLQTDAALYQSILTYEVCGPARAVGRARYVR